MGTTSDSHEQTSFFSILLFPPLPNNGENLSEKLEISLRTLEGKGNCGPICKF